MVRGALGLPALTSAAAAVTLSLFRDGGKTLANLVPSNIWGWLAVVFTVSQSVGFASNSYTIWEDSILLFFLGTFGLCFGPRRPESGVAGRPHAGGVPLGLVRRARAGWPRFPSCAGRSRCPTARQPTTRRPRRRPLRRGSS